MALALRESLDGSNQLEENMNNCNNSNSNNDRNHNNSNNSNDSNNSNEQTTHSQYVTDNIQQGSNTARPKNEKISSPRRFQFLLNLAKKQWFLIGLGIVIGLAAAWPNLGKKKGIIHSEYSVKYGVTGLIFVLSGMGLKTRVLAGAIIFWKSHLGISFIFFYLSILAIHSFFFFLIYFFYFFFDLIDLYLFRSLFVFL